MVMVCSAFDGQLLAVPSSRYSYPGMGFRDTFADCTPPRKQKGMLSAWNRGIPILSDYHGGQAASVGCYYNIEPLKTSVQSVERWSV